MRVFPEDKKIKVSKLIRLWVAEEFIKPARGKTLEEVAETYLKDFIDMNLIFIRGWKINGKVKSIGIHDLLRDLCLREWERENFIRVPRVQRMYAKKENQYKCYLCHNHAISSDEIANALGVRLHTKLRYISIGSKSLNTYYEENTISPSVLSLLWNLQTLYIKSNIVRPDIVIPFEIWAMPQLRHINIISAVLPDPVEAQDHTTIILENLQKLSVIQKFRCTKEVVERIPNLKELKVEYGDDMEEWSYYCLHNLAGLQKLESLSIDCSVCAKSFLLKSITFPTSLKQLVLSGCRFPWEDMTTIGSLPNLEVLKLYWFAFEGAEWNPIEGKFLRLKALSLRACEPECWGVEDIHFPSLEVFTLEFSYNLKEIPSSIGDIATLKLIRLRHCNDLIENSAKQILEEQQSNGNESLQVVICQGDYWPK
ncbi:UNVERIFIED_CONTAM: putative late blight resistance proteinR1B-16 [Sesamum latifolium]|uniref:Late blight resistance proteinR1B-16 n=1 Tax=Sesamum latifolium TaxID=2727402 RepID=A0AAW2Y417_9LAMI